MTAPDLLTIGEVASVFRVTTDTVRRWAAIGRIKAVTLPGGQLRFKRAAVDAVLASDVKPECAHCGKRIVGQPAEIDEDADAAWCSGECHDESLAAQALRVT